jgi:hypothetical protein
VVKNEEQILVVDVTVRYVNGDFLQKAEKEKINKYQTCLDYLMNKYNLKEGKVLSIIVGSRGAITSNTMQNLSEIGVTRNNIKTIVLNVLRCSIEMCNVFLDG